MCGRVFGVELPTAVPEVHGRVLKHIRMSAAYNKVQPAWVNLYPNIVIHMYYISIEGILA